MEPMNWSAVILATVLAAGTVLLRHGSSFNGAIAHAERDDPLLRHVALIAALMFVSAVMLGHNFARIGADTLAAKPWLYAMQSGGLAIAFVIPAVWLTNTRRDAAQRTKVCDTAMWLFAYLAMGAAFWVLS